jgi:sec-independent protein translocase protein TatB
MGDNGRVMDIGWGEILLLGALALLIFGPDKLPKAAADAGRMVRKLREMASSAQQDITPGLDVEGIKADLRSVADLHPKRIISSALSDQPKPAAKPVAQPVSAETATSDSAPARAAAPRIDPDAT